jgi:tetratricopeptide (TPR) repeat protein
MLELNIGSLIYTALIGFGLIGAQAALTKKNFMLTVSSPARLTSEGYTSDAIEGLMLNELQQMLRTRSVITAPIINSIDDKSFLSSLAELAHMGELSLAMQQAIGNAPYRVSANFVLEDGKVIAQVYGNSARGLFHQVVPPGTGIRDLIKRTAHAAIRNIDPYFLALHNFELGPSGHGLEFVENLVNEELNRRKLTPTSRAAFLNLKGLVRLDQGDTAGALAAFASALETDPEFAVARVNRAFTLVMLDRHPEAVEAAREVLGPPPKTEIKQVTMAAETLIAVSKWVHGDHAGAETYFARAATRIPAARTPVLYWSRLVAAAGKEDASLHKLAMTDDVRLYDDDLYAEIAMLYYWVSEKDSPAPIVRRSPTGRAGGLHPGANLPAAKAAPAPQVPPAKQ